MRIPFIIVPFPLLINYDAMAVFPFIFVKRNDYRHDVVLINHEKIHLAQQLEMLLIPFYVLYFGHYLFNLLKYRNHDEAYQNICFEQEAYTHEMDLNYLKRRKFWNFWRYFGTKE